MKKLLIIFLLIFIIGCTSNKNKSAKIEMYCNDIKTEVEIKSGDFLSCKLLETDYEFKINEISDSKIDIEVNNYGLTDNNSLLKKETKYEINKNSDLKLTTQTEDYQENVIFKWKE